MLALLDIPSKYPSLWLGTFAVGSVMCITAIGYSLGAAAAGYASGFLALSGTFGYELITRRKRDDTIKLKMDNIETEQSRLARELARTRSDIDTMKDDMIVATRAFVKDRNNTNPSTAKTIQRSFDRINNRSKPSSFMTQMAPANISSQNDETPVELRAQKYKNLLRTPIEDDLPAQKDLSFPEYTDAMVTELIHQAIQNDKIEIFAQPIVKLPSRRLCYLELYARIRAKTGIYLAGQKYRSLAEKESLIENVDHQLLIHTIDHIRNDHRRDLNIGYFLNISSRSLKDTIFMTDLLEFVRTRRDLSARLILEFQQHDFLSLPPTSQRIIDGLTRIGCLISIDNVTDFGINVDQLLERGISFLKYDAQKIIEQSKSYEGEMTMTRLKTSLDRAGIAMIVEKIETNHTLKELLDYEVDFGEGHLFGRPDLEMAYRPKRPAFAS